MATKKAKPKKRAPKKPMKSRTIDPFDAAMDAAMLHGDVEDAIPDLVDDMARLHSKVDRIDERLKLFGRELGEILRRLPRTPH